MARTLKSDHLMLKIWTLLLTVACLWATTPLRGSAPHPKNVESWCGSASWCVSGPGRTRQMAAIVNLVSGGVRV